LRLYDSKYFAEAPLQSEISGESSVRSVRTILIQGKIMPHFTNYIIRYFTN